MDGWLGNGGQGAGRRAGAAAAGTADRHRRRAGRVGRLPAADLGGPPAGCHRRRRRHRRRGRCDGAAQAGRAAGQQSGEAGRATTQFQPAWRPGRLLRRPCGRDPWPRRPQPAERPDGRPAAQPDPRHGALLPRGSHRPPARAYDFFREKGWTAAQSAGVVANLRHESGAGLDHQAQGDGGRAFGLAQWHPDRQRAFRLWAGKPIQQATFQEQLGFVHYELTKGGERAAGEALRNTRTAAEAGAVSRRYERPANAEGEEAARARTA
ncbi:phage tail tip lysozyme, partial [Teichococcus wenyumeiae]